MYSYRDRPLAPARSQSGALAFLRRVYLLFTGGVWFAVVGALVALYAGTPVELVARGGHAVSLPPVVAFAMQHWFLMFIGYIAAFFGASFLRRVRGVNVVALFGYAFITGLFIAPSIFVAQAMASTGATLD